MLPAFFALLAFLSILSHDLTPSGADETQILKLGGIALLIGLLLVGLEHPVHAMFSDYPLRLVIGLLGVDAELDPRWRPPRLWRDDRLRRPSLRSQQNAFDKMQAASRQGDSGALLREILESRLGSDRSQLRPTRFGNVSRSHEDYIRDRWHLTPKAWARIWMLLPEAERQRHMEQKTSIEFFLSGSVVTGAFAALLLVDQAIVMAEGDLASGCCASCWSRCS